MNLPFNRRWSALLLALALGVSTPAMAAEEPAYDLVASLGDVEIRRYGPAVLALTPMSTPDGGFRTLAGYIFGGNESGEKIAMTAPVQRDLSGDNPRMAFFMPAQYDMAALPEPGDEGVELREVPARTVAVLGFSGRARDAQVIERRRALEASLDEAGVEAAGNWLLNQYNPPWTPPFMRRNEIWVDVAWPGDSPGD